MIGTMMQIYRDSVDQLHEPLLPYQAKPMNP